MCFTEKVLLKPTFLANFKKKVPKFLHFQLTLRLINSISVPSYIDPVCRRAVVKLK